MSEEDQSTVWFVAGFASGVAAIALAAALPWYAALAASMAWSAICSLAAMAATVEDPD